MWNPWRSIRQQRDITVRWEQMDDRLGEWCEDSRTITLDPRQVQAERRCTAMHELIHAERGHRDCQPERVELSVRKECARRLICVHRLAEALIFYGDDLAQVADELWTDQDTLRTRLEHLHPAERGYIIRRLAAREGAA